ncbi:MAG TPA: phage portal protein, partial [Phycisphaerae bacterium]|nr:phage portal protein [Phycisphaerae bacterium]
WEWIAKGVPWIDPLKEVNADIAAVGAGLTSRTRICKARGEDFGDIAQELADENKLLTDLGLPTNVTPANAQIVEIAQ